METCAVLGTPLAVTDYAGAVCEVKSHAAQGGGPYLVAAANTHVVTLARREPGYAESLARFDLILPDGMPLVWVMNQHLPQKLEDRVYGPTFMLHCLEATQGEPWRHLFIGGSEGTLTKLEAELLARFPLLQIAGKYSPPFGEWGVEEDARILEVIKDARANFVWIGLGCPKQENWLARHKPQLPPAVYGAVGAAFAFHAGEVRQAPLWIQRRGLEWLFRLCTEPGRLWKRYFVFNSLFVGYLLRDVVLGRRR